MQYVGIKCLCILLRIHISYLRQALLYNDGAVLYRDTRLCVSKWLLFTFRFSVPLGFVTTLCRAKYKRTGTMFLHRLSISSLKEVHLQKFTYFLSLLGTIFEENRKPG
jgi:hypothetical protein